MGHPIQSNGSKLGRHCTKSQGELNSSIIIQSQWREFPLHTNLAHNVLYIKVKTAVKNGVVHMRSANEGAKDPFFTYVNISSCLIVMVTWDVTEGRCYCTYCTPPATLRNNRQNTYIVSHIDIDTNLEKGADLSQPTILTCLQQFHLLGQQRRTT